MDSLPHPGLQLAVKLSTFPLAFLLTGYTFSLSHTSRALVDHKPQTTAPAFTAINVSASSVLTTGTLASTAASAYLAYASSTSQREWTISAVSMGLVMPWIWLVMGKGLARLAQISRDTKATAKSEMSLEHRQILVRYSKQIYVVLALQLCSAYYALSAST